MRGGAQGRVAESSRMGAIETIGDLEVEDVDDTRNEIGQALYKVSVALVSNAQT